MKVNLPLASLLAAAFCFIAGAALGQVPVFNSVNANTSSIQKMAKFELSINLTASYTNPYDYNDIAVQCIFSAPSGRKDTVDAFYMQDYTLDPATGNIAASGPPLFRVRYAPNETGDWSYALSCTTTSGSATRAPQTFTCVAAANHGFIRKNASNYLGFDDGAQYIPVGENMCWQDNNVYTDYSNWLSKLSDNGGNFIRVWMSSWAFALEWKNGTRGFQGLKQYRQSSAFWLDWLLDYCQQKGVYMMLCINNHGQVSTNVNPEWTDNPYNSANGGPCANTWDFFTNITARDYHKNRLRYLVARYGYSTNIQSWELFNEVEWTNNFTAHKAEISSWHAEMAAYLKSKDVYKHLVTTSYAQDVNDPITWSLPDIDFTQTHYYVSAPSTESILSAGAQSYLAQFNKPTINGEFGLSGSSGDAEVTMDPAGVHIHNSIWGSAFSGAMGAAMTWWWDTYVNPRNLYYHYKPLSAVLSNLLLKDDQYKAVAATSSGGGAADLSVSPGAGFGKSPASDFTIDAAGKLTPGATQLSSYLFGSVFNTQNRNPPTFHITYPVAGQFKVVVTSGSQGSSPKIDIYLDGIQVFDSIAAPGKTYTINVPAGAHAIKIDNLGTDWANISSYVFANAGAPVTIYNLSSANGMKSAGWILNNQYNWKYLQDHGAAAPPAISGATISIPGITNGSYMVKMYDCSSGNLSSTINGVDVTNGTLSFALPDVSWDLAYSVVNNASLPIKLAKFYGESASGKNNLFIKIDEAVNVKAVDIERSGNGTVFARLGSLEASTLTGSHAYTDANPLPGKNYYRLKITDKDGKQAYSAVVVLNANVTRRISIRPNPVGDQVVMYFTNADKGNYSIKISNVEGRVALSSNYNVSAGDQVITIPFNNYGKGVYVAEIKDGLGKTLSTLKITK